MSATYNISVKALVGPLCVSADDGQRLHDAIAKAIRGGKRVKVSFDGVQIIISAFLNAALGQLYGEFSEEVIRAHLSVSDMNAEDLDLLRRVIENAKVYFENRKSFDDAWKSEVGDE